MRRAVPIVLLLVTSLAACGSSGGSADNTTANSSASTADCKAPATSSSDPSATTEAPAPATKPEVKVPSEIPTKLVITDLIEGTGDPAAEGDTVDVNYVGVVTSSGEEFDNSYDKGQSFPVTIGQTSVIEGWTQGLVGIKEGGRRQLDIPAELAYGDSPPGDVIKPGDALTFVVEAVNVTKAVTVPTALPTDKPKVEVPKSVGAKEVTTKDLVEGDGDVATPGDTAYVQLIAYRGDTGEELQSTWESGQPAQIVLDESYVPGLVNGVLCMKVGGRRVVTIPPEDAFGEAGSTQMGLPASTDLVMVIDLVKVVSADGS